MLSGYPSLGYVEFVLSPEGLRKNRRYSTIWREYLHTQQQQQQQQQSTPLESSQTRTAQSNSGSSSIISSSSLSPDLTVDYTALYAARQGANTPFVNCTFCLLPPDTASQYAS